MTDLDYKELFEKIKAELGDLPIIAENLGFIDAKAEKLLEDSTYPGMGIVQSGGKNEFIRYYFSKFEDLEEYYQQRGLDELGYSPIDSEFSGNSQLEDLDGEIEITVNRDKSKYEFEKNSVEIDNREEQDWREV